MVFRRSADADDEVTNTLIDRGVYRLSEVYEDEEIKKFRDLQVPYSFWSAVKYSFILTVLLWWLPVFGQMVAGFVGGRRAGKPWKGVLAALVPLTMIFIVSLLVENGTIPTVIMGFDWTPSRLLVMIEEAVPLLAPYIVFVDMYMTSFIDTIQISTNMRMDVYIITAAFAYIGGILAEQSRREMSYVARHGGNSMTVNVSSGERAEPPEDRRAVRGNRPVSARPSRARQEQKVIRFSDLQDLTTAADDGYGEEYSGGRERWYEEGEEPEDEEPVPRNIAGLAKRTSKRPAKEKPLKPGDWKFI